MFWQTKNVTEVAKSVWVARNATEVTQSMSEVAKNVFEPKMAIEITKNVTEVAKMFLQYVAVYRSL